jgi:DNA-directed RNA polymerase III subunit RPC2
MKPAFTLGKDKKSSINKRYRALDDTGTPRVGELLNNGDIIINKYSPGSLDGTEPLKPQPETYKGANPAYVDRVILTSTPDSPDPYFFKFITRQTRVPEIGDKFSSRHG